MTTATARAGETIDAICWRELGRTRDVTEQVLALNPGLAALGPALPAGTTVILPEVAQIAPALRETVNLWD
ncbi:P2-like prophage tail protein X [Novosphingobium sp. CF614]|uniref:tail protein X n=1 Tax=Novosphingobium sp. CF614 TaxID=1884364 RepID=UPI0008DFBF4D|nr:tail protein X [Novosphingobium sp. CF614]SFG08398.1 P2-like prophage tail protein X [Novosphingobium sp. CF614]